MGALLVRLDIADPDKQHAALSRHGDVLAEVGEQGVNFPVVGAAPGTGAVEREPDFAFTAFLRHNCGRRQVAMFPRCRQVGCLHTRPDDPTRS